jgi:hypothetical protein
MAIPTLNPSDVFGAAERGLTARNVNLLRGQEQEDRRNTLAAQQQAAAQQQVINRLIAENTDPTTGEVDRARLSIGLANAGQGGAIFGAQENVDKRAAAVAGLGKTRAETGEIVQNTSDKERAAKYDQITKLLNFVAGAETPEGYATQYAIASQMMQPGQLEQMGFTPTFEPDKVRAARLSLQSEKDRLEREEQLRRFSIDKGTLGVRQGELGVSRGRLAFDKAAAAAPAPSAENEVARVVTADDGTTRFFNKFGVEVTPRSAAGAPINVPGKPSAAFEKRRAQKQQLEKDLGFAITSLTEAIKEGGMLDRSTGSGIGRGADIAANFFGMSTEGSTAIAELQPIADLVLKMVPRFEGPQSDRDTLSYQQAAGRLADPNIPREDRKAAAKVILNLMKSRRSQFVSSDMAAEGATAGDDVVDTSNPLLQ